MILNLTFDIISSSRNVTAYKIITTAKNLQVFFGATPDTSSSCPVIRQFPFSLLRFCIRDARAANRRSPPILSLTSVTTPLMYRRTSLVLPIPRLMLS
jgi:hypothetical protein